LTAKGQTLVSKLKEEYADLHAQMLKEKSLDDRERIYIGISLMQDVVSQWLDRNN